MTHVHTNKRPNGTEWKPEYFPKELASQCPRSPPSALLSEKGSDYEVLVVYGEKLQDHLS